MQIYIYSLKRGNFFTHLDLKILFLPYVNFHDESLAWLVKYYNMIVLLFCILLGFVLYLSQNNLKSYYYEIKRLYFYFDCHCGISSFCGLMVMSFLKFGILATMGELLGLRISRGVYYFKGFGVLPRAIVWGILGMGINMAFIVFSTGVPAFAEYLGVKDTAAILSGALSWQKVALAFSISVVLNSIFAPVFMTLHKITDTHIMNNGGTL